MAILGRWLGKKTEWCPGGGDWAHDAHRWNKAVKHEYFCAGCGRSCKIPQRGHRVGLVPSHKRVVGTKFTPSPNGGD